MCEPLCSSGTLTVIVQEVLFITDTAIMFEMEWSHQIRRMFMDMKHERKNGVADLMHSGKVLADKT